MNIGRSRFLIGLLTVIPLVLMPYAFIRIAHGDRDPVLANIIIVDGIPFVASLMWWTHQTKWILEPLWERNPKVFRNTVFIAAFLIFLALRLYALQAR